MRAAPFNISLLKNNRRLKILRYVFIILLLICVVFVTLRLKNNQKAFRPLFILLVWIKRGPDLAAAFYLSTGPIWHISIWLWIKSGSCRYRHREETLFIPDTVWFVNPVIFSKRFLKKVICGKFHLSKKIFSVVLQYGKKPSTCNWLPIGARYFNVEYATSAVSFFLFLNSAFIKFSPQSCASQIKWQQQSSRFCESRAN